jgi:serine/threonine-protein kinase RsbW/sigma-B regulation protein RsbU (phosphoserine phosphatase)
MNRDLHLTVRSDPKLLASVRSLVRSWVNSWEVDEKTADEVVLAIDEACTNAIRHAYEGRRDGSVELTLHAAEKHLEFQVSDSGVPCPPECTERRPLHPPDVDDMQPGGLGIQLIHKVFDEVDFCPGVSGGNCVTMKLKRSK